MVVTLRIRDKKCAVIFILLLLILVLTKCLEIIPERAGLSYVNEKYVKDCLVNVRRYSRRGSYVVNIEGTILHTWANNITMQIKFYEFLHNEYKPSFIEMNYKFCDLINHDIYMGPLLRQIGLVCPLRRGKYTLPNLTLADIPAVHNFPYKWPFEKGKAAATFRSNPDKVLIVEGFLIITFKNKK